MHDNLSVATDERGANLHKRPLNQLVDMEGFQLDSKTVYRDKTNMIQIIAKACHIVSSEVYVRLGFLKGFLLLAAMQMILTVIWVTICELASDTVHQ